MAAMNMNQEQFEQAIREKSPFWWISGRLVQLLPEDPTRV